ncbi:hypothetical protein SCACP_21720 [Sporomusa carbonis]|uniref:helix-turn-helix domain-containing protein n=1 Tax=Sporomusa carbonis TaxID=3076075 RepID=UPI003A6DB625
MEPMFKVALTPKEAAQISPFGENRIRQLCLSDPSFPAFKNGRDIIIPRKGFEEWLEKQASYRVGFPEPLRRLATRRQSINEGLSHR